MSCRMIWFEGWLLTYIVAFVSFTLFLAGSLLRERLPTVSIALRGASSVLLLIYSVFIMSNATDFVRGSFALLASLIALFLVPYTSSYERRKYPGMNLSIVIDMFVLSVYMVFVSENLFSFIMFWLFAEIAGFFTIVFEVERRTLIAGLRYLLISMVPADVALLSILGIAAIKHGFTQALLVPLSEVSTVLSDLNPVLYLIIAVGFMAKAAVAPLHFWLPDAHSLAPAPGSAILSGVMVKMGIYGLFLTIPAVTSPYVYYTLIALASLTVIYGGLQALIQSDIKRVLAYSTIENTSLITIALISYKLFNMNTLLTAAVIYSLAHGIFKASLFMNSGTIEIITHTRDISKLGYLARIAGKPTLTAILSILSLIGAPPTLGFLGKILLLAGLVSLYQASMTIAITLLVVAALGAALAVAYGLRYITVYWGATPTKGFEGLKLNPGTENPELGLSLLNVVASLPIYAVLTVFGFLTLDLLYIVPIGLATVMMLALIFYTYSYVRRSAREESWLGGVLP
ncbi:MAG: complex I subunit 5 family protein [Zestosphaera sp.]